MSKAQRLLTILVFSLWVTPAMAQAEVRPYPDPGHRWLGVDAGGPEQHFDYFLRKLSLGDTFPDKAAWCEGLRKERTAQDGAHRHDVCNDVLSYEDDFQATRWAHFGEVAADYPSHGGFRDGHFWVGGKGGTGTSSRLVQRISSPRPLKELTVIADCNADAPNLGGSVTLSIAPRQGQPRWSVTSQGRHDGPLSLKVPSEELRELRDFDLHILLSSSSGVEQADKACAVLRRIQVQAK